MSRALWTPLALVAAMSTVPAFAAAPPPPDGVWLGAGQGGLLFSSGNTKSTAINAKLDLARNDGPWTNVLGLGGLYGKNNGILSSERISGRYELDHKISDRLFWFGDVDATRDIFSGFAYQVSLAGGLGYKFIDTADTKLSGTLGLGYQRLEQQQLIRDASGAVIQRINGNSQGGLVGTAGLSFEQKLTATTKLTDKFLVTSGSINTTASNDLALAVSMSDKLALSFGYGVRYNTSPAAGVTKLDQLTAVNFVYSIK